MSPALPDSGLTALVRGLCERRAGKGVYIVGLTGAVAVGKSTLAAALKVRIEGEPDRPRVEIACTDGFLLANDEVARRDLTARKGFPESYDAQAMRQALIAARGGPATFPGYSHINYDVDGRLARTIDRPDVLIVEGLGLGSPASLMPVDCLVYLDAAEADVAAWFVARFVAFWRAGQADAASFYARFAHFTEEEARALARRVWEGVNLPNLHAHILPLRAVADMVAHKASDHRLDRIDIRALGTPSGGSAEIVS